MIFVFLFMNFKSSENTPLSTVTKIFSYKTGKNIFIYSITFVEMPSVWQALIILKLLIINKYIFTGTEESKPDP